MSSDTHQSAQIWPYLVMLAFTLVLLLLLGRPCEFYRLKVSLTESAFPWMGTVCAPWPGGQCTCSTTDPTNSMIIQEGGKVYDPMHRDEIVPEVVF